MGLFLPGTPRIALLNSSGARVTTLYLPPPDVDGGVTLEWVEKGFNSELMLGGESWRRLGWIPELKLKWKNYNDVLQVGQRPFGAADGNMAPLPALLAMLDYPVGSVSVSPGPSAGGFVINKTTVSPIGTVGLQGIATGLQLTLRGGAILPAKMLGAF